MKRVVIVGGGYAGVTLAKALDEVFDVVLIERKDRFYHNVGAMRAYADASLFPRLLIPYDRLLRRGRVVFDEAVSVATGFVRAESGASWEGDTIVVATGSRHVMPFKCDFRDSSLFLAEAEGMSARLAAAESVAIVGDGPVAVELAGEVSWRYPRKRILLIGGAERLLASAGNPRLGERLLATLRGRGVEVVLGKPVSGEGLGVDLVIRAYGAETTVPWLGATGRVAVDGHFEVPGMPGVFAIGDAAESREPPLTFLARRQARYLANYLKAGGMAAYRPVKRVAMAVPLGPEEGAVQLPLPGLPVFGGWLTSRLKGRDLFIRKNWAVFNREAGS
ncbi:MAG: NAD(P)/FAD-dependent oxidoreductase [Bryobacteraceae bacterium]